MEATASLKYNHNKNLILTELRIPDYDVEAVTKLAVTDSESGENKLRGITIDITNKNIPQLTFVGRARYVCYAVMGKSDKICPVKLKILLNVDLIL